MAGYFRMEVKVVSRTAIRSNGSIGKNSSLNAASYISAKIYQNKKSEAIEAAAYISGSELQGLENTSDYRAKKGVLDSWVMLPENAPKEFYDPEKLWNAVEQNEKAKNADLYREWIICFDKHLNLEEMKIVAMEFGQSLVDEGMAIHIALHDEKDGNQNYHMHVLATLRGFEKDGSFDRQKTYPRGFAIDEYGQRIPVIDKKTGKQKIGVGGRKVWKREPIKYVRDFNDYRIDNVSRWRRMFCEIENKYLPEEYQVTPDSYKKQGLDIIPGKHLGKAASNVRKKLREQVQGLSPEKRKEYLERILKQVQSDYRRVYYENSRFISDERKQLHKEISDSLQAVKPYKPQKEYISYCSLFNKSKIALEYAFAKLLYFNRYMCQEQMHKESYETTIKAMEKIAEAEEDLLIMFSTGLTASMENRLIQGVFEMDKELLKQLGKEIRQTEAEIEKLKEKLTEVEENAIKKQLDEYEQRIQSIRKSQIAKSAQGTGRVDSTVANSTIGYAERISELSDELEASISRFGRTRDEVANTSRRIAELRRRESEKTISGIEKEIRRGKAIKF